jgi:hypothetical protein
LFGVIGSVLLSWMAFSKAMGHDIGTRPILQVGVLLVVVAVQLITLGLIAELIIHTRKARGPEDFADEP